jgi:hypothetical protein
MGNTVVASGSIPTVERLEQMLKSALQTATDPSNRDRNPSLPTAAVGFTGRGDYGKGNPAGTNAPS